MTIRRSARLSHAATTSCDLTNDAVTSRPVSRTVTRNGDEKEARVTFGDLPQEVLSLICSFCSTKSLLQLAGTSNTLYDLATASQLSYWSTLTLSASPKDKEDVTSAFLKFLSLRPHLATQLKDIHIHTANDGDRIRNTLLLKAIAKVIRLAPTVRTLWLHGESYGEEVPAVMVDLMLDRLAMLEDVSLVALSWPRNHEPAKLKPKQAMAKKLDRMTLIASQTAFLAAISRRVEEIGQLELAHMHGPLTSGLHDCIGVWSKVRGLVVGVHASSFCINELERATYNGHEIHLTSLFIHEILSITSLLRFSVNIPLVQPEALASISFILPAHEAPGETLDTIAQYAPALKQLAINCDWLGTSVDLESRRWMVATRRGQVACEMPENVTSWQNYMLELLPHLTPTSFPALERLVFRRPGLIDWPGFTTETTIAPHPDLRRFFNVAFAQLPTLLHGAQLLRCTSLRKRAVPTTAASTNGDATAVEVPVEEDEQVLHEELEHSGGVTTAAWWTWSRRAEGSKGRDVAVPRRVTSLAAGMQHYAIKQSCFADELPTL